MLLSELFVPAAASATAGGAGAADGASATPSPTPFPDYTGDPNLITPGVAGFLIILAVAIVTILLIIDMNRRIRRSRYREEVPIKLEEEQGAAADTADDQTP